MLARPVARFLSIAHRKVRRTERKFARASPFVAQIGHLRLDARYPGGDLVALGLDIVEGHEVRGPHEPADLLALAPQLLRGAHPLGRPRLKREPSARGGGCDDEHGDRAGATRAPDQMPLECRQERGHVGPPPVAPRRQAALDDPANAGRHPVPARQAGRPLAPARARVGVSWSLARQRLPERDAERELVGPGRHLASADLLRRHVRERSHPLVAQREAHVQDAAVDDRLRTRLGGLVGSGPGEPEVHDHDAVLSHDHIGRLEVAMHDARRVRGLQPAPGGDEDSQDLAPAAFLVAEPLGERRSFDELHRDEDLLSLGVDLVHRHHVGMVQEGQRLGFAKETRARPWRRGPVGADELECDGSSELRVDGRIDPAHAAGADEAAHGVASDAITRTKLDRGPRSRIRLGRRLEVGTRWRGGQ